MGYYYDDDDFEGDGLYAAPNFTSNCVSLSPDGRLRALFHDYMQVNPPQSMTLGFTYRLTLEGWNSPDSAAGASGLHFDDPDAVDFFSEKFGFAMRSDLMPYRLYVEVPPGAGFSSLRSMPARPWKWSADSERFAVGLTDFAAGVNAVVVFDFPGEYYTFKPLDHSPRLDEINPIIDPVLERHTRYNIRRIPSANGNYYIDVYADHKIAVKRVYTSGSLIDPALLPPISQPGTEPIYAWAKGVVSFAYAVEGERGSEGGVILIMPQMRNAYRFSVADRVKRLYFQDGYRRFEAVTRPEESDRDRVTVISPLATRLLSSSEPISEEEAAALGRNQLDFVIESPDHSRGLIIRPRVPIFISDDRLLYATTDWGMRSADITYEQTTLIAREIKGFEFITGYRRPQRSRETYWRWSDDSSAVSHLTRRREGEEYIYYLTRIDFVTHAVTHERVGSRLPQPAGLETLFEEIC